MTTYLACFSLIFLKSLFLHEKEIQFSLDVKNILSCIQLNIFLDITLTKTNTTRFHWSLVDNNFIFMLSFILNVYILVVFLHVDESW